MAKLKTLNSLIQEPGIFIKRISQLSVYIAKSRRNGTGTVRGRYIYMCDRNGNTGRIKDRVHQQLQDERSEWSESISWNKDYTIVRHHQSQSEVVHEGHNKEIRRSDSRQRQEIVHNTDGAGFEAQRQGRKRHDDGASFVRSSVSVQNIIFALLYLSTHTHPDIAYVMGVLSGLSKTVNYRACKTVKRVFIYLRVTIDVGIIFGRSTLTIYWQASARPQTVIMQQRSINFPIDSDCFTPNP